MSQRNDSSARVPQHIQTAPVACCRQLKATHLSLLAQVPDQSAILSEVIQHKVRFGEFILNKENRSAVRGHCQSHGFAALLQPGDESRFPGRKLKESYIRLTFRGVITVGSADRLRQ
jgi:hypothetical protein